MPSFKCPVCKTGTVNFDEKGKKGTCSHCGSLFTSTQADGFILKKLNNKDYTKSFYEMREKQNEAVGLKAHEWDNVAQGGMTDREKERAEKKQAEEEKQRRFDSMIVTTTNEIEERPIKEYKGIITGQVAAGVGIFKDAFAGIRNVVGGRSEALQKTMSQMREEALKDLKQEAFNRDANAIVGVTLDFDEYGESMLLLTVTGTAVVVS
jgi:uncharacterized protein YbjQ (UPF0145 family)